MSDRLAVKNPYTGELLAELAWAKDTDLRHALERASTAFAFARKTTAYTRSQWLSETARVLKSKKEDFAKSILEEAGKPITLARSEVDRAVFTLEWASEEALRFSEQSIRIDVTVNARSGLGRIARFPRGPALGITPFNFPLNLLVHKVAPALAVGCPVIIKPSPATPLTALKFVECLPYDARPLVQILIATDEQTAALTRAPEIQYVSFTGSAHIGKQIQEQARKPLTLELGGNAWTAVLKDIEEGDFEKIVQLIVDGAFGYAGQSCVSVQNVAVHESLAAPIRTRLEAKVSQFPFGDPSLPEVLAGPMINGQAKKRVEGILAQIASHPSQPKITHSKNRLGPGHVNLVPPTMVDWGTLSKLPHREEWIQEEIFAPIFIFHTFSNLDALITQINSSPYGLQTGVFTQHLGSIEQLFQDLNVGGLIINDVPTKRLDHQPYGGVKESGEGREGIFCAMQELTVNKFLNLSSQIPL